MASATLAGGTPVTPSVDPGSVAGYVPLDAFGVTPFPVGDEQALNFNVPAYRYGGEAFTRVGITSDGYLVAGGAAGGDIQFDPLPFPNTARRNNVLAPLWTDLDGTGTPGIFITVLTDGASRWIVVEWRLNTFGTSELQVFQAWLGITGTEDNTFAYDPANLPTNPEGLNLLVGAENAEGTAGDSIVGLPIGDLRVTTAPAVPGGMLTYSVQVKGVQPGLQRVTTSLTTPIVAGTTQEVDAINVL